MLSGLEHSLLYGLGLWRFGVGDAGDDDAY